MRSAVTSMWTAAICACCCTGLSRPLSLNLSRRKRELRPAAAASETFCALESLLKRKDSRMNHEEAIRMMGTEQYLLNELSPELREQFEEHFFDCGICAQ